MRPLTVLSVAYPFAPVGPDAAGGAEQVLTRLDAALVEAGHRSIVLACAGSTTRGACVETRAVSGVLTDAVRGEIQRAHARAILEVLERERVDLVHLHGIDFWTYLPPPGAAVLITLHLPPSWYPEWIFRLERPRTWMHCVSRSQRRACRGEASLLPEIENGVPVDALRGCFRKCRYVAALGRVCPEKNLHTAIEAAVRADVPLLLAGEVFPYEAHQQYFREQILPRLDGLRRFVGPVGFERKRRLLSCARCVLVPSLAPETSSLVAMEALACGTPVVAMASGALPEVVEHGVTGFIVHDVEEMAEAIRAAEGIDPQVCRDTARRRFSADRMAQEYLALYERLVRENVATDAEVPMGESAGPTRAELPLAGAAAHGVSPGDGAA